MQRMPPTPAAAQIATGSKENAGKWVREKTNAEETLIADATALEIGREKGFNKIVEEK